LTVREIITVGREKGWLLPKKSKFGCVLLDLDKAAIHFFISNFNENCSVNLVIHYIYLKNCHKKVYNKFEVFATFHFEVIDFSI
jgi:hypothetical protein